MIIKLLPDQVANYWTAFVDNIGDNMPPHADYGPYDMNNVLESIMMGGMQLWLIVEKEDQTKPLGFVLTTILRDVSGVSTLLVYSCVFFTKIRGSIIREGLKTLIKYGKGRGCSKIASFISNDKMLDACKSYGIDTRFVFVNYNI